MVGGGVHVGRSWWWKVNGRCLVRSGGAMLRGAPTCSTGVIRIPVVEGGSGGG